MVAGQCIPQPSLCEGAAARILRRPPTLVSLRWGSPPPDRPSSSLPFLSFLFFALSGAAVDAWAPLWCFKCPHAFVPQEPCAPFVDLPVATVVRVIMGSGPWSRCW